MYLDADYNLVGSGTDDFLQIHGTKDHGGLGASSGIDSHTHKLAKVERPATPTTPRTSTGLQKA